MRLFLLRESQNSNESVCYKINSKKNPTLKGEISIFNKILLILLAFCSLSNLALGDSIRVDVISVEGNPDNVEFFYEIFPHDTQISTDQRADEILAFIQNKEESYFNLFSRDPITELSLKNKLRVFVVEVSSGEEQKNLTIFFADKKNSYVVRCSGPKKTISLTNGQCAEMLYSAAKLKITNRNLKKAIDRTPS